MSTGAIIAIVVAALILIALFAFVLPRMRARARVKARERELQSRRERVAGEHRAEADQRERQAAQAEQHARIAQREAEAQRAQAELHQERAGLHEQGMADDELIDDSERDRFAGTSAMQPASERDMDDDRRRSTADADGDGRTLDDRATGRTTADEGSVAAGSEYQQGRRDEAMDREGRFNRDETAAESERTTR